MSVDELIEKFSRLSEEGGLFYEFIPYSSIGSFWVDEGSIYEEVYRRLPLGRLSNIAALVAITYMPSLRVNKDVTYFPYSHSRLDHSLCVGKGMEIVFQNNGFDQQSVDKAVFIGLIHDIATPAFGDAAISVDFTRLNEEDNWRDSVNGGFGFFSGKYGISDEDVDSALHSKGIFGKVLDMVDKVIYVVKDLYAMLGPSDFKGIFAKAYDNLERMVFRPPMIGDNLLEIRIRDNEAYFENPESLGKLLLARAILHKSVYLNPVSQARDYLISRMVASLYDEGSLTPGILRKMCDNDLFYVLGQRFDIPNYGQNFYSFQFFRPSYKRFGCLSDAEDYLASLKSRNIPVLGVKEVRRFNPSTSFLVEEKGELLPFFKYDPKAAARLERLACSRAGFYVFHDFNDGQVERIVSRL